MMDTPGRADGRVTHALRTLLVLGGAAACGAADPAGGAPSGAEPAQLILASTTSTEDSGLFEALLPAFEAAHPELDVKVIAVGTGEALELGRRKDADVLLVHAPAAESAFVARGHGAERREVMHNDFVIVGPPADPAGIRGTAPAAAALRRLAEARAPFVSRGDDSGTHTRERQLWRDAGVEPAGAWYQDAGQGMGDVLRIAGEKRAYTLTDRATYLNLREALDLDVLVEGDERLFNPYGVIPVAGAANVEGGRVFADWVTGPAAQALIGRFGAERFGRPLFVPSATR